MRLDTILAMIAPTRIALASRIRRRIRNASPNVVIRSESVLQFVIHKIF
jgi:hypothetical protein